MIYRKLFPKLTWSGNYMALWRRDSNIHDVEQFNGIKQMLGRNFVQAIQTFVSVLI